MADDPSDKEQRRAAALRENLRRRKAQAREAAVAAVDAPVAAAGDQCGSSDPAA